LKYLLSCHIIVSDLYQAINYYSSFEERSKVPTLLFRGGTVNPLQLNTLPESINSDIEFLGFLSTSKKEKIAIEGFAQNTLFTIYIPNFFKSP
jgi:hypothetical protein